MTSTSTSTQDAQDTKKGPERGVLRRFVGAPLRADTYAKLLYVLLAFPLGIAYFTIVVTGLSFGIGASVTLLGLPVLVLTIAGVTVLGTVEARLASGLLDIDASPPEAVRADNPDGIRRVENGIWETLRDLFTAPTTWTALVLVLLKFAYGLLGFVTFVTLAALTGAFIGAPLVYSDPGVSYTIGAFAIDSLPEALGLAVAGVMLGFVSLHLLCGLATAGGKMTAALLELDRSEATE